MTFVFYTMNTNLKDHQSRRHQLDQMQYCKTPCPAPLNDHNFVKFMRGTGQGVQILVAILLKNEWKYLCY